MAGSVGSFGSLDGVAEALEALAAIPRGSSDPQSSSASSSSRTSSSSSSLSSSSSSGLDAWLIAIRAESGSPAAGAALPDASAASAAASCIETGDTPRDLDQYLEMTVSEEKISFLTKCPKDQLPREVLRFANMQISNWEEMRSEGLDLTKPTFEKFQTFNYSYTIDSDQSRYTIMAKDLEDSKLYDEEESGLSNRELLQIVVSQYRQLSKAKLFKIFASGAGAGAVSQPAKPGGLLERARTLSKGTLRAPTAREE